MQVFTLKFVPNLTLAQILKKKKNAKMKIPHFRFVLFNLKFSGELNSHEAK